MIEMFEELPSGAGKIARTYPAVWEVFAALGKATERWSHFLRQPVKVDLTTQRTIHHEDAETIFG
jgi:hypothetical protein